jgi:adenosylcobinamide amidohydrolase
MIWMDDRINGMVWRIVPAQGYTVMFPPSDRKYASTDGVQMPGTGADSVIIVSGATGPLATYTGGHSRLGKLIGKAVH